MSKANFVFEIPGRPAYEAWAALGWVTAAAIGGWATFKADLPVSTFIFFSAIAGGMGLIRASAAFRWFLRNRTMRRGGVILKPYSALKPTFDRARERNQLFLGWGFEWTPEIGEMAHLITSHGGIEEELRFEDEEDSDNYGAKFLHGLGVDREREVIPSIKLFKGQTLVTGTTRAGKTRLLELLVRQIIERREPLIIIDPKGDRDLLEVTRKAATESGIPDQFLMLHPAFPEQSCRIDPLANWNRRTELASRISNLLGDALGDAFVSFSWQTLNTLVNALIMLDERPSLMRLRRYIDRGFEWLVIATIERHAQNHGVSPSDIDSFVAGNFNKVPPKAVGRVVFYQRRLMPTVPDPDLEELINAFEHNREHYQKMIASLKPLMAMLTAKPLNELLSPVPDPADDRVITDLSRIIRNGQTAYIGLDALSDPTVASALASILCADIASVAGERYNYGDDLGEVWLLIDEMASALNDRVIEILNKGAGAGLRVIGGTQTLADLTVRLKSRDKAMQALGNFNNVIALRANDGETQQFLASQMPEIRVRSIQRNYRHDVESRVEVTSEASYGEGLTETYKPLFPEYQFNRIPNLEYIARFTGGRFIKGRIPIIT